MRRLKISVLFGIAALLALGSIGSRINHGQSQTPSQPPEANSGSRVKPTVMLPEEGGKAPGNTIGKAVGTAITPAALQNQALREQLNWTFGKKPQHGWRLYTLLINRLLGTEADSGSPAFATALAKWQIGLGLSPTGVLDEAALVGMIIQWQNVRLKDRTVAQPDQLLTAPSSDFYDPERLPELRQVERETYAAYRRMIAAAVADRSLGLTHDAQGGLANQEKYLKIISSFRTPEYQEQLRRESPDAGTAGLAVNSPHFTGRALDIYVGGAPVSTADANREIQVQTPVYRWLVRNAERFGFHPYFYEPWHWEYTGK